MGFLADVRTYAVTVLCSASRIIYEGGKSVFYTQQGVEYVTKTPHHAAETPLAVGTVIASLIVNILRIPSTYRQYSNKTTSTEQPHTPTHWYSKAVKYTLNIGGGLIYGMMNSVVAIFSTRELLGTIAKLFSSNMHDAPWKVGVSYTVGGTVALAMFGSFYAYDFANVKKNVSAITKAMDETGLKFDNTNNSMVKTFVTSWANSLVYPALSIRLTGPSLEAVGGKSILGEHGIKSVAIGSGIITFLATITWLPSVKNMFMPQAQNTQAATTTVTPNSCSAKILKAIIGPAGIYDSVVAGTGAYIGITFTLHEYFGVDPYNIAVICAAAYALLNGAVANGAFTVVPAGKDFIQTVCREKEVVDTEKEALLAEAGVGTNGGTFELGSATPVPVSPVFQAGV